MKWLNSLGQFLKAITELKGTVGSDRIRSKLGVASSQAFNAKSIEEIKE